MDRVANIVRTFATSARKEIVLLRFLAVGGFFSLLYSSLATLLALFGGADPAWASAIAYAVCVPPGYLAQRRLAFRATTPHRQAFPRYVALQAPLLGLAAGLSWLAVDVWGWNEALSFYAIGPTVAAVSFVAQRFWTFADR